MALNLKQIPTNGGGFFKPEAFRDALAILVEVKSFMANRPTKYGDKDTIVADVTVFNDAETLRNGMPAAAHQGMMIDKTILVRDLKDMIGSATIVRLDQVSTKAGGRAWVWRAVSDASIANGIVAYAEQRDAAVEEAVASAPSFD